jgi:hypothetical protein
MAKIEITIEIDDDRLDRYEDAHLAVLWHVAQANPAPHGDHAAGELVEHIGREIMRRWLGAAKPQLWRHQGRDYPHQQLCRFAKFVPGGVEPGSPEWHDGVWVPKVAGEDHGKEVEA